MKQFLNKLKWAYRLLFSRHYVIMLDEEAVICFNGIRPDHMEDQLELVQQTSSLLMFRDKLDDLILRHDKAIEKLYPKEADGTVEPARKVRSAQAKAPRVTRQKSQAKVRENANKAS